MYGLHSLCKLKPPTVRWACSVWDTVPVWSRLPHPSEAVPNLLSTETWDWWSLLLSILVLFTENSSTVDRDPNPFVLSFLGKCMYFPPVPLALQINIIHWLLKWRIQNALWTARPLPPSNYPSTHCLLPPFYYDSYIYSPPAQPFWIFSVSPLYLKIHCPTWPLAHASRICFMHPLDLHLLLGADWPTAPENGQVR